MSTVKRTDRVPPLPEFRAPQRATVVYSFEEAEERQEGREEGWGLLDKNGWLHFLADEHNRWISWPPHSLIQVEWAMDRDAAPLF
jgi:hypothetical protein